MTDPIAVPRARALLLTTAPYPLSVGQDRHNAFPWLARKLNGRLWLTWRNGPHHVDGRVGDIVQAFSDDDGYTWVSPEVIRTGGDLRDPCPFVHPVTGQRHLTWFTGTDANPAQGAFTQTPWGPTVRFDGGLPYAASCSPLALLPNGQLGGAFYGRKPGEITTTAWMAWFGPGGITTNRIASGIGVGIEHSEPVLLVDQELTHFFYRWGNRDGMGMRTSTASGLAGWSASRKILNNATGRPSVVRLNDGTIVMVYRRLPDYAAQIAYSADRGTTWTDGGTLHSSMGGLGCVYAGMVATGDRGAVGVLAMEDGGSARARLFGFRIETAGA